jgi:hypothetical protein
MPHAPPVEKQIHDTGGVGELCDHERPVDALMRADFERITWIRTFGRWAISAR